MAAALGAVLLTTMLAPAVGAQAPARAAPPCRSLEGTPLSDLVGTWAVEWRYRTAPGEFAESEARSEISLDLEGCVLVERFSGTLRGVPFAKTTMISQQPDGRFDQVGIDSEHGSFTQSAGRAYADSVVFERARDMGSRLLRTRQSFTRMGGSSFSVRAYLSRADGQPWELVQHADYRRVLADR